MGRVPPSLSTAQPAKMARAATTSRKRTRVVGVAE
jgi:hypothetical protein